MNYLTKLFKMTSSFFSHTSPLIETTTLTIIFKDLGTRQFIYRRVLDNIEICDVLNTIFEEHQDAEIEGDVEVFRYHRTDRQEEENLSYLPVPD
tara:strand:- start:567 stop:848 length:282 start_codon:yes stop_codon:yes gene_type:complete